MHSCDASPRGRRICSVCEKAKCHSLPRGRAEPTAAACACLPGVCRTLTVITVTAWCEGRATQRVQCAPPAAALQVDCGAEQTQPAVLREDARAQTERVSRARPPSFVENCSSKSRAGGDRQPRAPAPLPLLPPTQAVLAMLAASPDASTTQRCNSRQRWARCKSGMQGGAQGCCYRGRGGTERRVSTL